MRIILLLAAMLLAPHSASAQLQARADWPAVDSPQAYRMLGAAGQGGSACIGQPSTPLCAVETLLACFARLDEALCRVVWPQAPAGLMFGQEQRRQAYWWSYRVDQVRQLGPAEAEIAIAGRHCGLQTGEAVCRTTPAPATLYRVVRSQNGGGWQVLDWRSPPGEGAN